MKAIVDNKIPFIRGKMETLVDEVVYLPGAEIDAQAVGDADILVVRTRTRCDKQLLEHSTVKFIVTATIGFDHLDTDYLQERKIGWTNCAGCNAMSVVQYVETSLLTLHSREEWRSQKATAAVVGVGHVGKPMVKMLEQMGMNVLQCDPLRALTEKDFPHTQLEDIAEQADIITFHTPLTREGDFPTYHLADERFFQLLQRKPILINAARGEVVDTTELLRALKKGTVGCAIVDTWENEPQINRELLSEAYISTPHIAGYSADGKANATRMALESVARFVGKENTCEVEPPALPQDFHYGEELSGPLRLYDPRVDSNRLKAHPDWFEQLRSDYPMRREETSGKESILGKLKKIQSFKVGVVVLSLCVPCYVFSFAQMLLSLGAGVKTVLWVVFFGLAKTFQYGGIAIMGVEGYKRLKNYFKRKKK